MITDVRGLTLTTGSEAAAGHYNAAIDDYFEYRLSAGKRVKAALEADPDFAMAHCLQGYMFMMFGTTAVLGRARAAKAQARTAGGDRITAREAAHIAALGAWADGDMDRTCAIWDQILLDHPRDLLALRLQHFALFWMGRSAELRGGPARVIPAPPSGSWTGGMLLGRVCTGVSAERFMAFLSSESACFPAGVSGSS